MSVIENFRHYNLGQDDYTKAIISFSIFWIIVFAVAKFNFTAPKKLAWSVSIVNSFVLSVIGALYVYEMTLQLPQFQNFGPNGKVVFEKKDNISSLICVWMIVANVFDLIFGILFYPGELGILTAYIHHTVYIWAPYGFLTGSFFLHSIVAIF